MILGEKKPEPGEKETAEKPKKVSAFCNFWREIAVSDMVIGILGLCAIGLIIIPELVYVRDIYEESYARSNTMFKTAIIVGRSFKITQRFHTAKPGTIPISAGKWPRPFFP